MAVGVSFEADGWERFSLMLDRFSDNVQDAKPVFEAIAKKHQQNMAKQFNKQGMHTGGPWAPLSPGYAAWKQRYYPGKRIMELTGALRNELTTDAGIHKITATSMVEGTAIEYATYHQRGTGKMPRRELIGPPTPYDRRMFAKILQGWIIDRNVSV